MPLFFIRYITFLCFISLLTACKNNASHNKDATNRSKIEQLKLPAAAPLSNAEKQQLSHAVQQWYDTVLAPSVFNGGILVAKNGQIVFEKYRGTEPLGKDSVNASTPFHIASVSKTLTAMAVLKMWQDSLLQIDDELSKYFPQFNYPGVTIRSLLNHRSGLPNYVHFIDKLSWKDSAHISNTDLLHLLITQKASLENIGKPNSKFSYCNTNYALLALLIEKISGQPYPVYMAQHIFEPLGMQHSFVYTHTDSARASKNYDWKGTPIANNNLDYVYGDKNIYSTVQDLLIWHRALSAHLICNAQVLAQAYQPYSNEHPGIKNYGLGWRMNSYPNGKKVIFHNGWWHGNNAAFIRLLDEDACIIVLGNRYSRAIYKAYQLVNSFGSYFQVQEEVE